MSSHLHIVSEFPIAELKALKDAGGTSTHTLLPDTRAVTHGITVIGASNIQLLDRL